MRFFARRANISLFRWLSISGNPTTALPVGFTIARRSHSRDRTVPARASATWSAAVRAAVTHGDEPEVSLEVSATISPPTSPERNADVDRLQNQLADKEAELASKEEELRASEQTRNCAFLS